MRWDAFVCSVRIGVDWGRDTLEALDGYRHAECFSQYCWVSKERGLSVNVEATSRVERFIPGLRKGFL